MRLSYVLAAPEMMTAAATDLAAIGSALDDAHLTAAASTTGLIPAAADEVSTGVAALFSGYAKDFHALAGKASAFGDQFAQNLTASASAYARTEAANAAQIIPDPGVSAGNALTPFLQGLENGYLKLGNVVFFPLEQIIEAQGPLAQVAEVALFALLVPYTFSLIVLQEIVQVLSGLPI